MIHFLIICALLAAMIWIGGMVITFGFYAIIGIPMLIFAGLASLWRWVNTGRWSE